METKNNQEIQEISEAAKKLNLSSPRTDDKEFTRYWDTFIQDIQWRENLKQGHLIHLEFYCGLFCQARELEEVLAYEGHTFSNETEEEYEDDYGHRKKKKKTGRNGKQVKVRPESSIYLNIIKEIRQYSVMLGLTLVKDTKITNDSKDEDAAKEEWK